MFFIVLATLVLAVLASAAPVNSPGVPQTLIVFSPEITYPQANITWVMGSTYNVTWDTSNIPEGKVASMGLILLGHAGNNSENLYIAHPLATGFPIITGSVSVTMPRNVASRDDYFIVLLGDSGNASPTFKLVRPKEKSHALN
ncbi:hypothetical protein AX17_003678 [Amanita inopinata Kibby_2008]|nr:hypothetical protein AX17_003678 [Amanita inopinata Kibby_2008]